MVVIQNPGPFSKKSDHFLTKNCLKLTRTFMSNERHEWYLITNAKNLTKILGRWKLVVKIKLKNGQNIFKQQEWISTQRGHLLGLCSRRVGHLNPFGRIATINSKSNLPQNVFWNLDPSHAVIHETCVLIPSPLVLHYCLEGNELRIAPI